MLYDQRDITASMDRIETIQFHQVREHRQGERNNRQFLTIHALQEKAVSGIRFWAYHAGHVLGAAMFMIDIAGVKVGICR